MLLIRLILSFSTIFIYPDNKLVVSGNSFKTINSRVSTQHAYPWVAELVYNRAHICGGTLIKNNVVLTAAHCLRK